MTNFAVLDLRLFATIKAFLIQFALSRFLCIALSRKCEQYSNKIRNNIVKNIYIFCIEIRQKSYRRNGA